MANPAYSNAGHFYAPEVKPVLLNCSFNVDSANPSGVSNLTGPGISSVFMNYLPIPVTPTAVSLDPSGTIITVNSVAGLSVGMVVTDTTTPGNIPAGTTILSIDAIGITITVSQSTTVAPADALSISFPIAPGNPNPAVGLMMVQLSGFHNLYLAQYNGAITAPFTGSPILLSAGTLAPGAAYTVFDQGTSTLADFQAAGLPAGYQAVFGASFIATSAGSSTGTGTVVASSSSGVSSIEMIGNPTVTINGQTAAGSTGSLLIMECFQAGVATAPVDGSRVNLSFYLSDSSVKVQGQ